MEFVGKLTEAEFTEFERMARSKGYWVNVFLFFVGGPVCIWQSVSILLGSPTLRVWEVFILAYAGVIALLLFARYEQKRRRAEQLAGLNAKGDRFVLTAEGVKRETFEGTAKLLPWESFKDWREGQQIMLLNTYASGAVILPIAQLSELEREPIREYLKSRIPLARGGTSIFLSVSQPKAWHGVGESSPKLLRQGMFHCGLAQTEMKFRKRQRWNSQVGSPMPSLAISIA